VFLLESKSYPGIWLEDADGRKVAVSYGGGVVFKSFWATTGRIAVVSFTGELKNPIPYKVIVGEASTRIDSQITRDDTPTRVRGESAGRVHEITLQADKVYEVRMESKEMDSYLRLEDADGNILAMDDDSGGGLNAQIIVKPPRDGTYRVVATTLIPGYGSYLVTVRTRP
jgi:hypothetical protein